MSSVSGKILWIILKMFKEGTPTNGPNDKEIGVDERYPRDDEDRFYVSRKIDGIDLASIEDCVDSSTEFE